MTTTLLAARRALPLALLAAACSSTKDQLLGVENPNAITPDNLQSADGASRSPTA